MLARTATSMALMTLILFFVAIFSIRALGVNISVAQFPSSLSASLDRLGSQQLNVLGSSHGTGLVGQHLHHARPHPHAHAVVRQYGQKDELPPVPLVDNSITALHSWKVSPDLGCGSDGIACGQEPGGGSMYCAKKGSACCLPLGMTHCPEDHNCMPGGLKCCPKGERCVGHQY